MVSKENLEAGMDLQVGYEFLESNKLSAGLQLQLTKGLSTDTKSDDRTYLQYDAAGLYLIARPMNSWLQAKAGVVRSNYYTPSGNEDSLGYGTGLGLVIGSYDINVHLLDYQRLTFDNDSFNQYTISILIMLY